MNKPVTYDRARFPMIWVESVQAHLHFLPVTKIQFEYFLWDSASSSLDQAWLDRMYKLNPRVSPRQVDPRNYWRAFMTGVAPIEAEMYAQWCAGPEEEVRYSLPTAADWQKAYKELQERDANTWDPACLEQSPARAQTLFSQLLACPARRTKLADLMFFDGGVLEWVDTTGERSFGGEWGGYGQTHRNFVSSGPCLNRLFPVKAVPKSPEDNAGRGAYYGFRLLRRERT